MSETAMESATRARVAAELLGLGRAAAVAGGVMLAGGLLLAWIQPPATGLALALSLVAGVVQTVYALRTRFDAGIFRFWSARWVDGADPTADMAAFDHIVRGRPPATPRPLSSRIAGARRLLMWQLIWLGVQAVALVTAAALGDWSGSNPP